MGIGSTSSSTTVTITGGINQTTTVVISANRASAGTTAIYTVPAGKKAYYYGGVLSTDGANICAVEVNAVRSAVLYNSAASGLGEKVNTQQFYPTVLAAGQVINLVCDSRTSGTMYFYGTVVEQNV